MWWEAAPSCRSTDPRVTGVQCIAHTRASHREQCAAASQALSTKTITAKSNSEETQALLMGFAHY